MDDALLGIVLARLGQEMLADEPTDLLLAALDGDGALASQLRTGPAEHYPRPASAVSAPDPVGAYLSSVTVRGFRGIGPATTLAVKEGPGLTLVVGRNGSGKSSFAEGLEVLLTGSLMRLNSAPAVVKEGWRCKHLAGEPQVTAEFFVEGKGRTTIGRSWPVAAGDDVSKSEAWVQVHGEKQAPLQALGWDADLVAYRPFLSHAELEAFFGKPSELHDLLSSVLGLEDLTAAATRLQAAAKARDDKLSAAKRDLGPLQSQLAALAGHDERAENCARALPGVKPANWDIDAVLAIATGSHQQAGDEGQVARLLRLANLTAPAADEVTSAAGALREAAERVSGLVGTAAERAHELAALLDAALRHHHAHGDSSCPVCGNPGAMTPQWQADTEQYRDRLRDEARAADEAAVLAETAVTGARGLIQGLPQPLGNVTADDPAGTEPAAQAWRRWSALQEIAAALTAENLNALAERLESAYGPLDTAITTLVQQASQELKRLDDQWVPLAKELAVWCDAAARARSDAQHIAPLKAARQWLTGATAELRDRRLAPLADQSRGIWDDLRQESNVSLGAFRLAGTNTRRQLNLDVTIDGEPGSALGVMSQGEINALALSIFLPRATIAASPFRFLLIDDPVQAMDPAKVDGLAKVLSKVARQRQVIVFTHDNRLVSAVKDLAISATVMEVTRKPRSNVEVRACLDASAQAIQDARALSKDPNVPPEVAKRVIPGLCRTAAEAAFVEAFWRTELRRGRTRGHIEETLNEPGKHLNMRRAAMLALFGEQAESGKVSTRLKNQWGPRYADTYRTLNDSTHDGHSGDLANLIDDTKALVKQITVSFS